MLLLHPLQTEHLLYYDTKEEITAGRLADSLLGLEELANRAANLFGDLHGIDVEKVEVGIRSIVAGSYQESFFVRLIFGKGRTAETKIDALAKKLGFRGGDPKLVITAGIAGMVLLAAWKWLPPATSSQGVHIHQHFEDSFNAIGNHVGLSGNDFRHILEEANPDVATLVKQASRIVHPGGVTHVGGLTLDQEHGISIPAEILQKIPNANDLEVTKREEKVRALMWDGLTKLNLPGPDPKKAQSELVGVKVYIRAIDLDRPAKAGAVVVPSISDKRLPLSIEEGLDPASIPVGLEIEADVTILYRVYKSGRKKPIGCLLRKASVNQRPGKTE